MNNISNFLGIFPLIYLACSLYCLYQWYQIRRTGSIPDGFILLSKEYPMDRCTDPEAYRTYIQPRLLIFSLLLLAFGVIGTLEAFRGVLTNLTAGMEGWAGTLLRELFQSMLPFANLAWFAVCLVKIQRKLWP